MIEADPMQAFVIVMGAVLAVFAAGGFYSLWRVRKLDRLIKKG
jgi:uncharacterized membrane protein YccC